MAARDILKSTASMHMCILAKLTFPGFGPGFQPPSRHALVISCNDTLFVWIATVLFPHQLIQQSQKQKWGLNASWFTSVQLSNLSILGKAHVQTSSIHSSSHSVHIPPLTPSLSCYELQKAKISWAAHKHDLHCSSGSKTNKAFMI